MGVATVTATDPDGEPIFRQTKVTQALVQYHAVSVGEYRELVVEEPHRGRWVAVSSDSDWCFVEFVGHQKVACHVMRASLSL